jgi:hypothetical protein
MPNKHLSVDYLAKTLVKEINPTGIMLNAIRSAGCCMNHQDDEQELEQAIYAARSIERGKISRLNEEGRKLVRQHPEYKINLAELVKSEATIVGLLNEMGGADLRYAAIAAYHHKKSSRQKTKN